jgi:hypothetical protein
MGSRNRKGFRPRRDHWAERSGSHARSLSAQTLSILAPGTARYSRRFPCVGNSGQVATPHCVIRFPTATIKAEVLRPMRKKRDELAMHRVNSSAAGRLRPCSRDKPRKAANPTSASPTVDSRSAANDSPITRQNRPPPKGLGGKIGGEPLVQPVFSRVEPTPDRRCVGPVIDDGTFPQGIDGRHGSAEEQDHGPKSEASAGLPAGPGDKPISQVMLHRHNSSRRSGEERTVMLESISDGRREMTR